MDSTKKQAYIRMKMEELGALKRQKEFEQQKKLDLSSSKEYPSLSGKVVTSEQSTPKTKSYASTVASSSKPVKTSTNSLGSKGNPWSLKKTESGPSSKEFMGRPDDYDEDGEINPELLSPRRRGNRGDLW